MTIEFEESRKIISKYIEDVESCEEYEKGYVFYPKDEGNHKGGDSPLAVMKDSGEVKPLYLFFILDDNELIREIQL